MPKGRLSHWFLPVQNNDSTDRRRSGHKFLALEEGRASETTPLLPLTTIDEERAITSGAMTQPRRGGSMLNVSGKMAKAASRRVVNAGKATVRKPIRTVKRVVANRVRSSSDMDGSDEHIFLRENGTAIDDYDDSSIPSIMSDEDEEVPLAGSSSVGNLEVSSRRSFVTSRTNATVVEQVVTDPEWPIYSMERIMRQVVLVCAAYMIGAKNPGYLLQAARATEYAITAWATCILILTLAFFQRKYPHLLHPDLGATRRRILRVLPDESVTENDQLDDEEKAIPAQNDVAISDEAPELIASPGSLRRVTSGGESSMNAEDDITSFAPHPTLVPFYVMNAYTGERVVCNGEKPFRISNEWFEMDMVVLVRTPNVDDPSKPAGAPSNQQVSEYLRGKQRRFEFQYQMKLKKIPTGKQVYFACELEEPIKMGMIQRAFVGAAMAFIKTTNPQFHYSISGSKKTADGKYEKPHMAFLVEDGLNRLVTTKPGETPPVLGTEIVEDAESLKKRKKGIPIEWNTDDTYTMALWSAYVDFLDWRVTGLPGIRPFDLASVISNQSIGFTLYLTDDNRGNDKHYKKDLEYLVDLEVSNGVHSESGPSANKWLATHQKAKQRAAELEAPHLQLQGSLSKDMFDADDEDDRDAATAAELGEGIYLRSGDKVVLREYIVDGDEKALPYCLANGGGFCVLQNRDCTVLIEKAKNSKQNRLIKSGDAVMFKMIQKKGDDQETRFLTLHRGWWLKWVSTVPTKNGYFTIHRNDIEASRENPNGETQSSYLSLGDSFTLQHKRWSKFHVGAASDPSPLYGGRIMGLYSPEMQKGDHNKGGLTNDEQYHSDDDVELDENDMGPEGREDKSFWMKPLVLSAHEPSTSVAPKLTLEMSNSEEAIFDTTALMSTDDTSFKYSRQHAQIDVPAWIEMMNRTDRVRQLTYVVRITDRSNWNDDVEDEKSDGGNINQHLRLRTGRELAQVMRVGHSIRGLDEIGAGMQVKNTSSSAARSPSMDNSSSTPTTSRAASTPTRRSFSEFQTPSPMKQGLLSLSPKPTVTKKSSTSVPEEFSFSGLDEDNSSQGSSDEDEDEEEYAEDIEELEEEEIVDDEDEEGEIVDEEDVIDGPFSDDEQIESTDANEISALTIEPNSEDEDEVDPFGAELEGAKRKKSMNLIGKVAKTAKSATVATGKTAFKTVKGTGKLTKKTVVGTGKLTGKVAVNTGKLAVKTGKFTGKAVAGQSKKVAKGTVRVGKRTVNAGKAAAKGGKAITVTAGKAVIAPVSRKPKKPPKQQEPKKLALKDRKRHEKELQIGVSKSMKKIAKKEQKSAGILAGELCAPEQSCRSASRVLSRMSNVGANSTHYKKVNDVLSAQISPKTDNDRWFLEGSSVQIGVRPLSGDKSRGVQLHESLVARCLWESHWREEWCGMYESCLSFYAPLTDSPCLEIAYIDITNVRPLDPGEVNPLPGCPLLVLETAWLCHYIAFRNEEARDTFGEKVEDAIARHVKQVEESASIQQRDLRKARFWQGFQGLSEVSLSSGRGKVCFKFSSYILDRCCDVTLPCNRAYHFFLFIVGESFVVPEHET
jgi:hypothetical protein